MSCWIWCNVTGYLVEIKGGANIRTDLRNKEVSWMSIKKE